MNEVAVLVAKEDVCVHVCMYSGEDKRTNIDDIFAFSLTSYYCNSSYHWSSNSNNH